MGSSLKTGLEHLVHKTPEISSVLVLVCDQPLVTQRLLEKLISEHDRSGKLIVASGYGGTAGVPALFNKVLFDEIMGMEDDQGAKKIIQKHPNETVVIDFPEGAVDLDTPDDYEKFKRQFWELDGAQ